MTDAPIASRRRFLRRTLHGSAVWAAAGTPLIATGARAASDAPRLLALVHTHTHERIDLVYARQAHYLPDALARLNHFLRDHYSGAVGRIDPGLLDLLHAVQRTLGASQGFEVISGYRSPGTNEQLRLGRGGGVARHSLHLEGRAIDVRLPGVPLAELRDAALELQRGGVGFYASDRFVHLDTGRVRRW